MDERRDTELGRRLQAVGEPGHGPGYWEDVRRQVAAAASGRDMELGRLLDAVDEPEHRPGYWQEVRSRVAEASRRDGAPGLWRRLPAVFARRPVRLALAGAALAVLAAVALLSGLPQTHGPQPVSAEEVVKRAVRAYSSGSTWQTDMVIWLPNHAETYLSRMARDADGSYRLTQYDPEDAAAFLAGESGCRVTGVTVYDARTGVLRGLDRETRTLRITSGWPLGPPDMDPQTSPSGQDVGAILRALEAYGRVKLEHAVIAGRTAWTVTFTAGDLAGRPSSVLNSAVYQTTVDAKTWLPLRMTYENAGMLIGDARTVRSRVDLPLPRDTFVLQPRTGYRTVRRDKGFRRVSLVEAAATPGVRALLPGSLPPGYELAAIAVAEEAYTANHFVPGRHVFEAQYTCGFDALTVSTRTLTDEWYQTDLDPFEYTNDRGWVGLAGIKTRISAGAFAGAEARILIATLSSSPHLWAVKDGVLLTVAGGASAKELLAVAESLQDPDVTSSPGRP